MQAFSYTQAHALADFQIEKTTVSEPTLRPQDVLVRIKAFALNPIDYKIRQSRSAEAGHPVVLGWDAAGVIEKLGEKVTGFSVGDTVYYAGDLLRDGSYAELQAIDARLIAKKPESLSFPESAAMPLTTLTAWEALFERGINYTPETRVLIIGGAGGVGSMAIQLLKAKTPCKVIATATRPETIAWCQTMGADVILGRDLENEFKAHNIDSVDVVFCTTHTAEYLALIPNLLRPFGHLFLIDAPKTVDIAAYQNKALSVHWELMFAKSLHNYQMESQGSILKQVAEMLDTKQLSTTLGAVLPNSVEQIQHGHTLLETGQTIGKLVMEGF